MFGLLGLTANVRVLMPSRQIERQLVRKSVQLTSGIPSLRRSPSGPAR